MGTFATNITRWTERVKARADEVCRITALQLMTKIVLRSPVGNPELWAANAQAALQRSQHNVVADQVNAYLKSDPSNLTAKGNLKRSARSATNKRLSRAELVRAYPFRSGKGYVGGRFRGNWQLTVSAPATAALDRIDANGSETIADGAAAIAAFVAGPPIYLTNNLSYAVRLEHGWSKQAPAGMVRITAAEFGAIVEDAVRATA